MRKVQTLLERQDDRGIYRVLYIRDGSPEAHGEPGGIYADIAYFGGGYSQRCGSYVDACRIVFDEYGYTPGYARRRG
jgi:hypothetical protein